MRKPKFEVFKAVNSTWYWRLVGANGEKMALSESYIFRSTAEQGAKNAKAAAALAEIE